MTLTLTEISVGANRTAAREPRPPGARTHRFLLVVLLIELMILGAVRCLTIIGHFTQPTELSYPNSVMVHVARSVRDGGPIYRDYRKPPHVAAVYGPLTYGIPGVLGRLFDLEERGLMLVGRSVALVSLLATTLLLGRVARSSAPRPWYPTLVAMILLFSGDILWPVGLCFRPDAPEMFLVIGGVLLFQSQQGTAWRHASLPLFLTAFLYKQSAVVAPAACAAWLAVHGRSRSAVFFLASAALAIGGTAVVMNEVTDGLYKLNTLDALAARVTVGNLYSVVVESALLRNFIPFGIAAAIVVHRIGRRRDQPLDLYFALSFLAGAVAVVRDGSADNYFLSSYAAACLVAGRWLTSGSVVEQVVPRAAGDGESKPVQSRMNSRSGRGLDLVKVFMLGAAVIYYGAAVNHRVRQIPSLVELMRTRADRDRNQESFVRSAASLLDGLGGPVLCQFDPVNLYGRRTIMMDLLLFSGLTDRGGFDDQSVIGAIRRRRLAAVVLLFPVTTEPIPRYQSTAWVRREWVEAVRASGYHERRWGPLYVYTPEP